MGTDLVLYAFVFVVSCALLQGITMLVLARRYRHRPAARKARRRVSVLVPCFNERAVLHDTLAAILRSEGVDVRIICIDDGSTDGTADIVRAAISRHGSQITLLRQENRGKAAALNHGLTAVDTEFFVSIDADTQVMPDAIAGLVACFDRDDVAAVSGQMLVGNRSPASGVVCSAQVREYECANNIQRRAFSTLHCITVVPGAIGAFRTAAVKAAGGYPEETLAEDAHLTVLLLMAGQKVIHEPRAVALTEAPDTLSALFRQRVRWATGKTQVVLRTARAALGRPGTKTLVWMHMALQQAISPLFTLLGAVIPPAVVIVGLGLGWRLQGSDRLIGLSAAAAALAVLYLGQAWFASRYARDLDAGARAAANLPRGPAGPRSVLLIPALSFAAAWLAWFSVLTGRRRGWHKLRRSGDVRLPTLSGGA